ncbi:LOW QUALITY PROTEIN: hypothetical protein IFM47457_06660 [Aspergillus lentulus]|nr:LOW QUALITY PROTEIN: hypothetical protein IFM47457_06660 [Aspergillus lentulus]
MLKNSLAGFWGLEETGKANLLPMTEDYSFKKNALRNQRTLYLHARFDECAYRSERLVRALHVMNNQR